MKVKVIVTALVLAFIGTFASAGEINLSSLAGKEWPKLEGALAKDHLLKDGQFPTSVLGQVAYDKVKRSKLPGQELTEDAYIAFFKVKNNLGDKIAVAEFRTPGRAEQITLPGTVVLESEVAPVAAATPVAEVATVAATKPMSSDTVLGRKYDILNGQVEALKAQLAGGGDEKRMEHLAGLVSAMQAEIKSQKGNEANFAQKAELDKLSQNLNGLTGRMGAVEKTVSALPAMIKKEATDAVDAKLTPVKAEVAAVKSLAMATEAKRAAMTDDGKYMTYFYVILGALALLFIGMFMNRRQLKELRKDVEEGPDDFLAEKDLGTSQKAVKEPVVEAAPQKSVQPIVKREVVMEANVEECLYGLKLGESYTFKVRIAGSSHESYLVRATASKTVDHVVLKGIEDATTEVPISSVVYSIRRAAQYRTNGKPPRLIGVQEGITDVEVKRLSPGTHTQNPMGLGYSQAAA